MNPPPPPLLLNSVCYLLMLILGRNTGSVGSGMALVTACARVSSWRWSELNCGQEPGPASSCGHRPQLAGTKLLSPHRAAADARFHSGLVTSGWWERRLVTGSPRVSVQVPGVEMQELLLLGDNTVLATLTPCRLHPAPAQLSVLCQQEVTAGPDC